MTRLLLVFLACSLIPPKGAAAEAERWAKWETAFTLGEKCRSTEPGNRLACLSYLRGATDVIAQISGEAATRQASAPLCLDNITADVIRVRFLELLDANAVQAQKRLPAPSVIAALMRHTFRCFVHDSLLPPEEGK